MGMQQTNQIQTDEDKRKFLESYLSSKEMAQVYQIQKKSVNDFTDNDWKTWRLKQDIEELEQLSKLPKDTKIYTILRHVSSSGMSRIIDAFYIGEHGPIRIHFGTGKIFWKRENKSDDKAGFRVSGCGMDMGFHLVNSLSYLVSKYATGESDGYYFKQEWI